jgi:hypothetical protein
MEGEVLAALIGAGASLFVAALTFFDSRRGRKSQDKHLSAELDKFKAETGKLALETDELRRRPKEAEQKRNLRLLSKFLEPLRQTLEQNRLIFNGLIGERGALEYHPKRLREYFSSLPHGDPRKLTWLRRIERLRDNNREILGLMLQHGGDIATDEFRVAGAAFRYHADEWEDVWKAVTFTALGEEGDERDDVGEIPGDVMSAIAAGDEPLYANRFPKELEAALEAEISEVRSRVAAAQ